MRTPPFSTIWPHELRNRANISSRFMVAAATSRGQVGSRRFLDNRWCPARCLRGRYVLGLLTLAVLTCGIGQRVYAQDAKENSDPETPASANDNAEQLALFKAFADRLTGAVLVGHFTISGMDLEKPLQEERYEIRSVTRMGSGDYWLFRARIKYGDHDVTVPMPLPVKWAGKTPVITLDHVTIPKLGTFDARVVIDGTRYAGTWQHDDVGGHLFGRIEKLEGKPSAEDEGSDGEESR